MRQLTTALYLLVLLSLPAVSLSFQIGVTNPRVAARSTTAMQAERTPPWQHALSVRGVSAGKLSRDDLPQIFEAFGDMYHPENNPEGVLTLLVADNSLGKRKLLDRFQSTSQDAAIPQWVADYGMPEGNIEFRTVLAKTMEEHILKAPVDPGCLVALPGVGACVDSLGWALGMPGDTCIVPAPLYSAFAEDLNKRGAVKLKQANTRHPTYDLTEEILDQTYQDAVAEGAPPTMLMLCSPCNPLGKIYDASTLKMCMRWCAEREMHLISDEIYAASLFPGQKFTSVAQLCHEMAPDNPDYLGNRVHVLWGLSKDFGLPGLRVGTVLTHNSELRKSLSELAMTQQVSSLAQHAVTLALQDQAWVGDYLSDTSVQLEAAYRGMEEALRAINVPVYPAQGTLMAWADFRHYLREPSFDAERELWLQLLEQSRVLLTAGHTCGSSVPGFFRLCYAFPATPPSDPAGAMRVLKQRLTAHFGDRVDSGPPRRWGAEP